RADRTVQDLPHRLGGRAAPAHRRPIRRSAGTKRGEFGGSGGQRPGSPGDGPYAGRTARGRLDGRRASHHRRDRASLSNGRRIPSGGRARMMKGFKRLLRIYSRLAAIHWGIMLQYRAEVTIWAFWSVTSPIVYLAVWRAIAQARGPIGGYEADAFVGYFLLQSIVYHFTSAWQVYDFGHEIRSGEFSSKLLRPMDPVHQWVTQNAAFKLVNFIWLAPAWVGLFLYFRPAIAFSWESVVGFIAALAAAALLRFLWSQAW